MSLQSGKKGEELLKKANDELLSLTEELEEREEELAEQIQEIVRAKNEWEGIFQAIGNPILILDPSNQICDANHVILALSGKTLEELRTMKCWELFHGSSITQPPECCPFEEMKVSGKLETAEMEVEAFGEVFLVSCSPIFNPDGTLDRVIHIATNITEQKRVEEALISAQKKLKETHRLAHIGTWEWTKGDDIVTWSEELCTIAGTDHELPAPTYAELPRFFTSSSWQRLDDALRRTMTSGEPYSLELELIRPDGTIRWVIAFLGVTRDKMGTITGLHGTLQDITDRKLAEESLRESEAILQDFIENNPMSIQIVDSDGFTLSVNRAHTMLFGSTPPSDFSIFSDLIHKQPELEKYILLLKDGEMVNLPDILYNVHDTYPEYPDNPVWIRAIMFPLPDKNGKPKKFVFMHENITERKQAQEVLHESNKKLRMLTGITRHDIFNQLATVQIFQDLALVTSDLEKIHEYIYRAKEAGDRIEKTIGFTREYENFGIASSGWQLIHHIIESAKGEISPDNIIIQNLIPQNLEVYADPIIRKVFTTLIENAVRHGGSPSEIIFTCGKQDESVIITCKDDGVGVPSEEKEYIFDHGYGKHTGIGLFLAREILSITGLSIRECGVFGEGARFEIHVPTGKYRIQ
jgi:PAS domain S-box-containing protein